MGEVSREPEPGESISPLTIEIVLLVEFAINNVVGDGKTIAGIVALGEVVVERAGICLQGKEDQTSSLAFMR